MDPIERPADLAHVTDEHLQALHADGDPLAAEELAHRGVDTRELDGPEVDPTTPSRRHTLALLAAVAHGQTVTGIQVDEDGTASITLGASQIVLHPDGHLSVLDASVQIKAFAHAERQVMQAGRPVLYRDPAGSVLTGTICGVEVQPAPAEALYRIHWAHGRLDRALYHPSQLTPLRVTEAAA